MRRHSKLAIAFKIVTPRIGGLQSWWTRFVGAFAGGADGGNGDPIVSAAALAPVDQLNTTLAVAPSASIDWRSLSIDGRPIASILVFFSGLTLARVGLWAADLSITQIMQVLNASKFNF